MQVIRFAGCKSAPWKNGGGITTELVTDTPGATLDTFQWRLSVARIDRSGAFSRYAGVDRTLAVIGGSSVTLRIEGRAPLLLTPGRGLAAFPGELDVHAKVAGTGSEDFNVMSRRGRWNHALARMELWATTRIERRADVAFLFHAAGPAVAVVASDRVSLQLQPRDGVLLDANDDDAVEVVPAGSTTLLLVDLFRVQQ